MKEPSLGTEQIINNCYILKEYLGFDGFCEVWKACAIFSATFFTLRFFQEGIPEPLLEEQRRLVMRAYAVTHQSIRDIVEIDSYENRLFISSEYEGQLSLSAVVTHGGGFTLEHICGFSLELARGLDAFHRQGITYGTLNPLTINLRFENARVSELKMSKPGYLPLMETLKQKPEELRRSVYSYTAPECRGLYDAPPSPASDCYSIGALLYFFLTGKEDQGGRGKDKAASDPLSVQKASNDLLALGLNDEFIIIVLSCLRLNPALRYACMGDFIASLKGYLDERRARSLSMGGLDPLDDIERLNKGKPVTGAEEIVRRLDMAEYFRSLTRSGQLGAAEDEMPVFPHPSLVELKPEVLGPSAQLVDDDALSPEDFLQRSRLLFEKSGQHVPAMASRKPAQGKGGAVASSETKRDQGSVEQTPLRKESNTQDLGPKLETRAAASESKIESEPSPISAITLSGISERGEPSLTQENTPARAKKKGVSTDKSIQAQASRPKKLKKAADDDDHLAWHHETFEISNLAVFMKSAFDAASLGHGSFRYIKLVASPQFIDSIGEVLAEIGQLGMLLQFPGNIKSIVGFRMALAEELKKAKSQLPNSVAVNEHFEEILSCLDSAIEKSSKNEKAEAEYHKAAEALLKLGKKGRPLALALISNTLIDKGMRAFQAAIAEIAATSFLCVFAFFPGRPPMEARLKVDLPWRMTIQDETLGEE